MNETEKAISKIQEALDKTYNIPTPYFGVKNDVDKIRQMLTTAIKLLGGVAWK